MQASDIMTANPRYCSARDSLQGVARIMREEDVGELPVVDEQKKLVGVITDRDIVVRCVAEGESPDTCVVDAYMTAPAVSLGEDASVEDVAHAMAREAVRRIPITNKEGRLCGMVAQADLEHSSARSQKEKVSQSVSTPH
jgi:CBS domain-containing protein